MQQTDTSHQGRLRSLVRRSATAVCAVGLALTGFLAPGVLAGGAGPRASAANGLTEESRATYVVGAKGKVTAEVTTTITNVTPDRGDRYYFFVDYSIPVPHSAKDVTATSGGTDLPVRLSASDDPSTRYAEVSFAPLRYGRTRTIEWTYRIAGDPIRDDELWTRVGPGYATFPVQAWGDDGRTRVVVQAPTGSTFDATDEFDEKAGDERTTYTLRENNGDGGIWSAVSVRDPERSDEKQLAVGDGDTLTVQSFPGDDAWLTFAAERIETGMPELERLIGDPWPGRIDVVREDVSPQVLGYAWFDDHGDEIVVGEEFDDATLYHELGHAWFDGERFTGRWLYEGLTEVTAYRVLDALGSDDAPRRAPDRDHADAFALLDWTDTEWDREADDYGYPAAYTAVQAVLGDLDDETFTAVVSAAFAGEDPYAAPGSDRITRAVDWQQFLDLAAERGGVDGTEAMRTWVVGSEDAALLDERTDARAAYAAYDDADGDWQPPRALRTAMTSWRFAAATDTVDALATTAPVAAAVQDAAETTGLPVPAAVLDAYDGAETAEDHAALPELLGEAATTIGAVGAARDTVAAQDDPVTELGQTLLGTAETAADARTALADGDLDRARALAADTQSAADRAPWVGAAVVVAALALLTGLVLLSLGRVRRRKRRATAEAGGPDTDTDTGSDTDADTHVEAGADQAAGDDAVEVGGHPR
ncbi:hypothetical protein ACNHYB_12725 [Isoptericola jiangsuensis]|uniref:hypothetical protein n=1 Tax=Isoptericola jiangsuensis TaxID=548579 RepID=UPI003AAB8787